MAIYKVYKNLGETPLECLERTRIEKGIEQSIPMTYAGRLDPAATGEMCILTGEDVKNKDVFSSKDKIYEVEYILGLKTDTSDLLGVILEMQEIKEFDEQVFVDALKSLEGEREQKFHNFSAKNIQGLPLWRHYILGNKVTASHIVNLKRLDVLEMSVVSLEDVYTKVLNLTKLVNQDFRQSKIIDSWSSLLDKKYKFIIVKVYANVSSGTYMRVLGDELGDILNIPICAYSIDRKTIIE